MRDTFHAFVTIDIAASRHFWPANAARKRDALQHIASRKRPSGAGLLRGNILEDDGLKPLLTIAMVLMHKCHVLMIWRA